LKLIPVVSNRYFPRNKLAERYRLNARRPFLGFVGYREKGDAQNCTLVLQAFLLGKVDALDPNVLAC
jgi:hypothetical protein